MNSDRFRGASQPATAVNFDVPRGTCDCLTHIFGNPEHFPMASTRPYTPEFASVEEIQALHRALHVDRVVIVQTTIYGTDNSCMLDAIKQLGPNARGVAVIDDKTTQAELDEMDRGGVRGIRINLETLGLTDPSIARKRFQAAVDKIRDRAGWHIQIYTRPSVIEAIYDLILECPIPLSFDHFGGTQASGGMEETGFKLLLDLLRSGKVYVKLTGPELVSKLGPEYPDVIPLAKALIDANRERVLWGSHWPHPNSYMAPGQKSTDLAALRQIDDGYVFNLLPHWVPDATDRQAVLVDNPARLFGF